LGDSLDSILFTPQFVHVYTLTSKEKSDKAERIGGYAVDSLVYTLKSEDLSVFQHAFLCDTMNYRVLQTVRAPFSPTFAFGFVKETSRVYLLFSLFNREWRIVGEEKELKSFALHTPFIEQIASELFPEEQ